MSARDMQARVDLAAERAFGKTEDLLLEWFRWWCETDDAPVKMPDSLHTRTACLLALRGYRDDVDRLMGRDHLIDPIEDGDCKTCGRPMLWGGMRWTRHTDEYHEGVRRQLLAAVQLVLYGKIAQATGHRIEVRFTQLYSWAHCVGCRWEGPLVRHSGYSRLHGRDHLVIEGRKVMGHYRSLGSGIKAQSAAERSGAVL